MRQHGLYHTQDAEEIGVEQRFSFGDRGLLRGAEQGHARAVDEDIDPLVLRDDGLNAARDRRLVTDVHFDERHAGNGLRFGDIADRPVDAAATFREFQRGGPADAG